MHHRNGPVSVTYLSDQTYCTKIGLFLSSQKNGYTWSFLFSRYLTHFALVMRPLLTKADYSVHPSVKMFDEI